MTRFGIFDEETETPSSPTLQLLKRVSLSANGGAESTNGNKGVGGSKVRGTDRRTTGPAETPGKRPSLDKREFLDAVRVSSSPLAASSSKKETLILQEAAWVRVFLSTLSLLPLSDREILHSNRNQQKQRPSPCVSFSSPWPCRLSSL
jgi:hypothetical protein